MGRRLAVAAVVLALLGCAGWLWRVRSRGPEALDGRWTATVSVLAGDGVADARDGPRSQARFSEPFGVAVASDGALVVSEGTIAPRVRRISGAGEVSTLTTAVTAPSGVAVGPDGTVYVADTGGNAILRILADGSTRAVAGGHRAGFADGNSSRARFNGPIGLTMTRNGDLIVADTYNDRIRLVTPAGNVQTLAGGLAGYRDGPSVGARFDTPSGVAVDDAGNIYVADTGNNLIRLISPTGLVTTVTPLREAGYFRPLGITVDPEGAVYVTDDGGRIFEIRPGISARLLAGGAAGFANGRAADARFRAPSGIAAVGSRRLVVTDRRNALIRLVEPVTQAAFRPPLSPTVRPAFDFDGFTETPLLWPADPQDGPFEITGTMGELRGGEGSERFHAGLDIRAPEGTFVRVVRDAVVAEPVAATDFGTLNESVRIGPLVYVHQRVGRTRTAVFDDDRFAPVYDDDGALVRMRVKRGARFLVGERLGTTNAFNHVHLNVGWPREEINPLAARLVQFVDRVQPTIGPRGIHLLDEQGVEFRARRKARLLVSGRIRIVVDAWDQVDGNRADRRLGLYRLGYQILRSSGEPVPGFDHVRETIRFDRLGPDPEAARLAYAPGSGIPFFGVRRTRFLYEVTNQMRGGVGTPGVWDSTSLPAGDYIVRVLATDFNGNVAIGNRDLPVTVQ